MARLRIPEVTDLGGYLREQREQARLSVRQLAQVAGVSNPYLSQIERGLRRPSAEVLQQIAKGLQISAEALYVRAGILEEAVGLDVEVAIRTDPLLTERQRRVLLEIYASFQAENGRAQARSGDQEPGHGRPVASGPATPARRATKRAAKKSAATKAGTTSPTPTTRRASRTTSSTPKKRTAADPATSPERTAP